VTRKKSLVTTSSWTTDEAILKKPVICETGPSAIDAKVLKNA
jgi:hypothetical protein